MGLTGNIDSYVTTPGSRCTAGAVLASLDAEDRERVREYIDTKINPRQHKYPASSVSAFLHENDIELSETTISRHRAGRCKCPR